VEETLDARRNILCHNLIQLINECDISARRIFSEKEQQCATVQFQDNNSLHPCNCLEDWTSSEAQATSLMLFHLNPAANEKKAK
jgi:hypothetical protein